MVLALVGITLVTRPEFIWGGEPAGASAVGALAPLAALAQAVTQSISALIVRKIPGKPSAASISFYVQLSMLLFGCCMVVYEYAEKKSLVVNLGSPGGPVTGMLLV